MAYLYARRHARDGRFSFGTGKLGDLAGFASAVILALVAPLIASESALRLAAKWMEPLARERVTDSASAAASA
jgi:Co/Zn/Cd efflux system component